MNVEAEWDRIAAEHQMQRAIKAWLGPTGTARYVVSRTIPTVALDGVTPVLGYVVDGVLYIHPDRAALIEAAVAKLNGAGR
jgi:hypothetical protein